MQDETPSSAREAGEREDTVIWNALMAAEQKTIASEDAPESLRTEPGAGVTGDADGAEHDDAHAGEALNSASAADDPAAEQGSGPEPDQIPDGLPINELDQLRAENSQLRHERSSNRGRITALQRLIEAERHGRGNAEPPPAANAEDDVFSEVYPEVAARQEWQARKVQAASMQREAALTDELSELVQTETVTLLNDHPDYVDLVNGNQEALEAFLTSDDITRKQLSAFQANSSFVTDAKKASEFVTAFKEYLGPTPHAGDRPGARTYPERDPSAGPGPDPYKHALAQRRKRQMEATDAPATGSGKPAMSGLSENASDEQIWKYWQDQERRQQR